MTVILKYNFNASFNQGPSESIKEEILMNTYDVVSIQVDSTVEKVIKILPDSTTAINFFCITSDQYDGELHYIIEPSAATPVDIVLDRPHVLIGKPILAQIGNFSEIKIQNNTQSKANIKILVGRDV